MWGRIERVAGAGFFLASATVAALSLASGQTDVAPTGAATAPEPVASPSGSSERIAVRPPADVTIAATGYITLGSTPELPPDGARSLFRGLA